MNLSVYLCCWSCCVAHCKHTLCDAVPEDRYTMCTPIGIISHTSFFLHFSISPLILYIRCYENNEKVENKHFEKWIKTNAYFLTRVLANRLPWIIMKQINDFVWLFFQIIYFSMHWTLNKGQCPLFIHLLTIWTEPDAWNYYVLMRTFPQK